MQQLSKAESLNEKEIFCPLVKVDEAKREVWTVVTAQVKDRDGETCHYKTTVPYYKNVVDEMSKASDGKNIFPLREMHGLSAAGKGIDIQFRDKEQEIYMGFKVVDNDAWNKVIEGVYTGVSQGGRYVKKWVEDDIKYYTAKPIEVSLVDMPCLERAHFDFIRADGTLEIRKFASAAAQIVDLIPMRRSITMLERQFNQFIRKASCSCGCANCKDGKCASCSADKKCEMASKAFDKAVKYLVSSGGENHLPYTNEDGSVNRRLCGAAWAALHDGYRGNKYEGPDKTKALKRLKQVYASNGWDTPSEKSIVANELLKTILVDKIQSKHFGESLEKGMWTVSRFASLIEDMKWLWISIEQEREIEGDESPVTDELKETFSAMLDHLVDYTSEQVEEEREKLHAKAWMAAFMKADESEPVTA